MFERICSIDVHDAASWEDKIFLTFDIDWAHDAILADTIDLVEQAGASATWFVTHETVLLDRLRSNPRFELGIHPNFNFLLESDSRNGSSAQEVVDRLMAIVPEAKSVRSHSLTQSSRLLDIFRAANLSFDSNDCIPAHTGIELKPWALWNGMVRVPYVWADDFSCLFDDLAAKDTQALVQLPGLRVLDFHPIHVFLNTENLERYEGVRPLFGRPEELIKRRFDGYGTRTRLLELLSLAA